jgi:predicted nucleotidyltransferase component of viral defense system
MMAINLIQDRLSSYSPQSIEEERNAIKEIIQEIILYGLSLSNFFDKALFQGGTALRIMHRLPRFSEDLDFILKTPNPQFDWSQYKEGIKNISEEFGIIPEIVDKNNVNSNVKKMFLKENSIGEMLNLSFKHQPNQKVTIKLEIDIQPPLGSISEIKYIDFPLNYAVEAQDLSSSFAGKSHALFCRKYVKGRDWYDFVWYVTKNVTPNLTLFENAIYQMGPWENKKINVTPTWYIEQLKNKIQEIDWAQAKSDVERFLNIRERQQMLPLWGKEFFMDRAEKLEFLMNNL